MTQAHPNQAAATFGALLCVCGSVFDPTRAMIACDGLPPPCRLPPSSLPHTPPQPHTDAAHTDTPAGYGPRRASTSLPHPTLPARPPTLYYGAGCGQWFHSECVDLDVDDFGSDNTFWCPFCHGLTLTPTLAPSGAPPATA